jgi:pimeloyl-ACP methyl ester carboxylesterase
LLVVHGGPDVGHSYLLPGFEPLALDHHVVLFDFRGCGRSTRGLPEEALQPEYVVEDARRLVDILELGQVDLLGFSAGGRAAVQFVDKHPDLVRKLVMASTSVYSRADSEANLEHWDEYQRRRRIEEAHKGALRKSTLSVWDLDLAPAYLRLLEGLDEGDWSYEAYLAGRMHPWFTGDPEAILRGWGKPILILHGDKDMDFPVQLAERLHTALPNSTLVTIENTGHMCHFEKPALWSQHIREFLASEEL